MNFPRVFARHLPVLFALCCLLCHPGRALAQSDPGSEHVLPPNTKAWVSVPDVQALKTAIEKTQFGAMMNDPQVKPFVDDLVQQLRTYLDEQNIRFGMKLEDIEQVQSGEICLAGVLRQGAAGVTETAPVDHAVVLLVDVSDSADQANELLEKIGRELTGREATEEKITVSGIEVSKWSFKKPQGLRQKQFAFHALAGKWLLACDNESVFRDIVSRIVKPREVAPTLAKSPAFEKVVEECRFEDGEFDLHVRWFVEPFGYVQLAQAIADAQTAGEGLRNDYAEKFSEEGFSAVQGVGGVLSVATGGYETVHRTFIYAPAEVEGEDRYKRAAAMLDFRNEAGDQLDPPDWVPATAAGYLTFTWDLKKALNKVGYIIDRTSGGEGSFERALDSLATDPQGPRVDMRTFVSHLNNRVTVCSVTEVPVDDNSERIVFGIRIEREESYINESIFKLVRDDAEVIEYKDTRIMVVDTSDTGEEIDELNIDGEFGGAFDDPLAEEDDEDDEEELKKPKPLFEKRVFAVRDGYLLIANNVDQVRSLIDTMASAPGKELAAAGDYVRVSEALKSLAGDQAPSFRHFGRLDQTLRTNYEMMRTGRMAQSKTMLAQLLNRAYTTDETPGDFVREQQIDGSKMPEDYDGQVARYLGPAGLVVHTVEEGWVITGCILEKTDGEQQTAADPADPVDLEKDLALDDR